MKIINIPVVFLDSKQYLINKNVIYIRDGNAFTAVTRDTGIHSTKVLIEETQNFAEQYAIEFAGWFGMRVKKYEDDPGWVVQALEDFKKEINGKK